MDYFSDLDIDLNIGQYAGRVPARPTLPPGCLLKQVIAVGSRQSDQVNWLVTKSEKDVGEWMAAIGSTLSPQATAPPPEYQMHQGPPPGYQRQQYQGYQGQQGQRRQGYGGYQEPRGNTTVIYGDGGRRDSGPGFGTGMLAGGLLGYGLGGGFGGWGMGGGFGGGFGNRGGFFNEENIQNETHETNNTIVNNYYGDEGDNLPGVPQDDFVEEDYGGGEDWGYEEDADFDGGMDLDMGDFGDF